MSDLGAKYTDEQIAKLEKQINIVYKEAEKDITRKLKEFNKKSEKKAAELLKKRDSGEISDAEYQAWLKGNAFRGQQWQAKRDEICAVMHNSNKIATNMLNKSTMGVFSENANYLAYSLEHGVGVDFGFSLYDQTTVTNLIKDNPDLLPKWKVDAQKDYVWNKRKVNRSITQGIIQGESLDDITKRISTGLASNNKNLMSTFARTGLTGAQSSGRATRIEEARKLGIDVQKEWMATLDGHTRTSHRILDGQIADDKGYFHAEGYKIRYPGDPQAHPSLVYNCRCTIVGNVKDYPDEYDRYDNIDGRPIKNMTYAEWAQAKTKGTIPLSTPTPTPTKVVGDVVEDLVEDVIEDVVEEASTNVVDGENIFDTWTRRSDEFEFEIEDVINAQGFDGLPRVVDANEFDELVKQANNGEGFIAQRTYSAPSQEILDEYRNQLYNGKWYVDCSTGGAQYGQGMYCAADYNGKLSSGIQEEMNHYISLNKQRARESGAQTAYSNVETLTLDKSAKVITYDDLMNLKFEKFRERQELIKNVEWRGKSEEEFHQDLKKARDYANAIMRINDGAFAALMGYDAINAVGHGASGSYTVVLNRTKVIFKGE